MITRHHTAAALTVALVAFTPSWPTSAQVAPKSTPAAARGAANGASAALKPAPSPEALGFDPQRLSRLDAYMARVVADGRVAGMVTLLARHGQVVSEKTYEIGRASCRERV